MAKVTIQKAAKLESLGKWQQPILDAIKTELPHSRSEYTPLQRESRAWSFFGKASLGLMSLSTRKKFALCFRTSA
jgi:hypothetical protein